MTCNKFPLPTANMDKKNQNPMFLALFFEKMLCFTEKKRLLNSFCGGENINSLIFVH